MPMENKSNIKMADILIVDDEIANLKLLAEILGREGYRVRPADSPKLAIDSALEKPPDLILLDVRMPDMDGFEVCDIFKKDDRTCDIPIIFISALHGTKEKVRGFEAGGVDFISKPFQDEEILARVRTHLKLYNLQRNLEEIAARRTAELTESEQLARTLLNATTDVTHLIDEEGTILDLNESIAARLGKTREELIGTCVFDYFSQEAAEARREIVRQVLVEGEPFRYKDRHHPSIVYDTGVFPIKTLPEEKDRVVIFAHDITEREEYEKKLKEREASLNEAQRMAKLGSWSWDPASGEVTWSRNLYDMMGLNPENPAPPFEKHATLYTPDSWAELNRAIERTLKNGEDYDLEVTAIRTDGRQVTCTIRGEAVRDRNGQIVMLQGTVQDITDRKKAEAELNFVKKTVDASQDGAYWVDTEGRYVNTNEAGHMSLGYSREELLQMSVFDIEPHLTIERWQANWKALRENKKLLTEGTLRRKDGSVFQVEITVNYFVFNGKEYAAGFAYDITERKQAEQNLEKNRDYLEHVINSIPDAVFSIRLPERTIEWVRDSFNVIVGQNLDDYIGKTAETLYYSAEEYQAMGKALRNAIVDNKDFYIIEVLLKNIKGEPFPAEINTTIYREKGVPVSATALVRDISFRRKTQDALENSEALLKEAQRIARIGNWELNHLTGALTWSDEVFSIFEINPANFSGKYEGFLDAIHPDDSGMVNEVYKLSLKNNEPYGIDHRLLMPDGRIKYVHEQCETVYSPAGKPMRSVGTVQDITERKKIEKKLKDAQAETMNLRLDMAHLNRIMTMNELAASFAHEINQPLGAIINNATVAKSMNKRLSGKSEEMDEILDDISEDAMLAGKIIRKIRTVMKKGEAVFTPLDVNLMLDDVIALYQNTFTLEHISVDMQKDPDPVTVKGDLLRLQQVLMNLITNALDAMKNRPEKVIKFRTFQSDSMVNVSISDTGSGIETNKTDKLFDPFYTTKKEGMGIGLRLCRSIIEEHGGQIWFENNPGSGATFYFSLKIFSEG